MHISFAKYLNIFNILILGCEPSMGRPIFQYPKACAILAYA